MTIDAPPPPPPPPPPEVPDDPIDDASYYDDMSVLDTEPPPEDAGPEGTVQVEGFEQSAAGMGGLDTEPPPEDDAPVSEVDGGATIQVAGSEAPDATEDSVAVGQDAVHLEDPTGPGDESSIETVPAVTQAVADESGSSNGDGSSEQADVPSPEVTEAASTDDPTTDSSEAEGDAPGDSTGDEPTGVEGEDPAESTAEAATTDSSEAEGDAPGDSTGDEPTGVEGEDPAAAEAQGAGADEPQRARDETYEDGGQATATSDQGEPTGAGTSTSEDPAAGEGTADDQGGIEAADPLMVEHSDVVSASADGVNGAVPSMEVPEGAQDRQNAENIVAIRQEQDNLHQQEEHAEAAALEAAVQQIPVSDAIKSDPQGYLDSLKWKGDMRDVRLGGDLHDPLPKGALDLLLLPGPLEIAGSLQAGTADSGTIPSEAAATGRPERDGPLTDSVTVLATFDDDVNRAMQQAFDTTVAHVVSTSPEEQKVGGAEGEQKDSGEDQKSILDQVRDGLMDAAWNFVPDAIAKVILVSTGADVSIITDLVKDIKEGLAPAWDVYKDQVDALRESGASPRDSLQMVGNTIRDDFIQDRPLMTTGIDFYSEIASDYLEPVRSVIGLGRSGLELGLQAAQLATNSVALTANRAAGLVTEVARTFWQQIGTAVKR